MLIKSKHTSKGAIHYTTLLVSKADNISQGSVATHLRNVGIFTNHFNAKLYLNALVGEFKEKKI